MNTTHDLLTEIAALKARAERAEAALAIARDDAPERIFAWVYKEGSRRHHVWRGKVGPGGDGQTEYVRADLSPAPDIGALVVAIEALGAPRPMWLRRLLSPIPTTCPRCGQHLTAYPDGGAGGYCSACEGGKANG